jgi:hypothetical protein
MEGEVEHAMPRTVCGTRWLKRRAEVARMTRGEGQVESLEREDTMHCGNEREAIDVMIQHEQVG